MKNLTDQALQDHVHERHDVLFDEGAALPLEHDTAIPQSGWLGEVIVKIAPIFSIGIAVSMLTLLCEIVLRYAFNSPTIWAHEVTTFLTSIAFVFAGLYCVAVDKHIRVVLIYDFLSPKWRRRMDVAISLINLVAVAFMAWAAWQMVQRSAFDPSGHWRLETSGSAWDPMFPGALKVFLLFVLVVMAMQFLRLLAGYLKKA